MGGGACMMKKLEALSWNAHLIRAWRQNICKVGNRYCPLFGIGQHKTGITTVGYRPPCVYLLSTWLHHTWPDFPDLPPPYLHAAWLWATKCNLFPLHGLHSYKPKTVSRMTLQSAQRSSSTCTQIKDDHKSCSTLGIIIGPTLLRSVYHAWQQLAWQVGQQQSSKLSLWTHSHVQTGKRQKTAE